MIEFWTLGIFVVANLVGVSFFFGSLCQKLKDLEDNVKVLSNHISSIQKSLIDIEVKVMNLHSRVIMIERKVDNEHRE